MRPFYLLFLLLFCIKPLLVEAAAPDDIATNQRGWYDAVDINANDIYTDNPANNTVISLWSDKSGSNNHLSQAGSKRPQYLHNNIGVQRHGISFDGIDDELSDADDIWIGATNSTESFIVATTDRVRSSTLFASTDNGLNRLSTHVPWGNNIFYFDHGYCCGSPTRLSGSVPITLSQAYFWHAIGLPSMQRILQDGRTRLNDGGAGTYNVTANSAFSIGGWPIGSASFHSHQGRVYEAIFYQTGLNNAQRRILSSYLSAKWARPFGSSPTYADVYIGDNVTNGDYDYFVAGIGQDNGTQTIGTSQGLTITDTSFLNANGKFITAGVNYLTTIPVTGTTTSDLPSNYAYRSNRTWYIDRTGSGGLVNLSFNAATIGVPVSNGSTYGLLHRTGTTGTFTEVSTATMSAGMLDFSYLPADGVYSIGLKEGVEFSLQKTRAIISDPSNNMTNPKAIPGSISDFTLTVQNAGNISPDSESTKISDSLPLNLTLFTGDLDGSGSPFVFTDNNCPPTTSTLSSNLTLDYPSDVVFKNSLGSVITPATLYDSAIRSFEITMSGTMNASSGSDIPCFTLKYRTRLE